MILKVDLTELSMRQRRILSETLTSEHAAQIVSAKVRQERLARFYHANKPRSIDGIGEQTMAVDPFFITWWKVKLGRDDIWEDPDFRKWLQKNEPATQVRSGGTKLQVGYRETAPARPAGITRVERGHRRSRTVY